MSWNAAVIFSFGLPIVSREKESLEVFADAQTHFGKLAADGKCSDPESYLLPYGGGFMIVKAEDTDAIYEVLFLEESRKLISKAEFTTDDFEFRVYHTGEVLMENLAFYSTVGTELGYL